MAAPLKRVPPAAPEPKKSEEARQAEADGFVIVEACGLKLRLPTGEDIPFLAYRAFKKGDDDEGIELVLGEKQFDAFIAKKPTMGDYKKIRDRFLESVGNSSAS